MRQPQQYAAFDESRLLARGPLSSMLKAVLDIAAANPGRPILIFNEESGRQVDFDLRGTLEDVMQRITQAAEPRTAGRPKLGVVSREVTLLPRHWTWLDQQRGGTSAALRMLVETAMRQSSAGVDSASIDAIYAQLSVLGGNLPGFEEASRCLYRSDWNGFVDAIRLWPADLTTYFKARLDEALDKAARE